MGTVVQTKFAQASASATVTAVLDSAVTNGNAILIFSNGQTQGHSSVTFDGSAATTDLAANFGIYRYSSYIADNSTATTAVATFNGAVNGEIMVLEVSGLDTTDLVEVTVDHAATGEGAATAHSFDYTGAAGGDYFAMAYCQTGNARTWTTTADVYPYTTAGTQPSTRALFIEDGFTAAADSIDVTVSGAAVSLIYELVLYNNAAASGGVPLAVFLNANQIIG